MTGMGDKTIRFDSESIGWDQWEKQWEKQWELTI